MTLCFVLMGRMHGRPATSDHTEEAHDGADVATLRQEVDQLRAELRGREGQSQAAPELNKN
jgi:hypothetical protein